MFAWVQSPFPFGGAQQTWLSTSGSNYGKYNNPQVDQLLNEAASSTDNAAALDKLNQADAILSEDAYVLPLYQKPVFIAVYSDYVFVRNNPTAEGQTYNIDEWAMKA